MAVTDDQKVEDPEMVKPFPCNLMEFLDRFGTDETCMEYLRTIRWPKGFK